MIATDAEVWLDEALRQVTLQPATIRRLFPMVTRKVGAGHEQARIRLLAALPDRTEIPGLYRYGDVNERLAILHSAEQLNADDALVALARDAFRSNDPRLVTACAQPSIVQRLDDDEVGQVLMKCVFMEVPLERIPAITRRATPRTARMVAGFVLERVCAGRDVAPDVWTVIDRYPAETEDEIKRIESELESSDPERRRAAAAALQSRPRH
ncbi:EboA domain-containing protein [Kineosporia rhizophila]|uniref:EboA domain-containing protein n=1 Tax=Kineosporia TaxID=49184 RepID=UPI000A43F8C9|nr:MULTISPECIES: EboA domain-containing protein [Kineosporia]MCE0539294.1 EboA domain-containing protein [Kineosporia rhizophila]GLY14419.1 hypothetical protein Kisp01_14340 [Kineosporia sp. NBRC 101677]